MADYREFQDGELILGTRYRVVRLIGVGGMGTVYEVEHVELGKRFVLKTLLRELARREDLVIRLRNEWRALGRLEHPNIVNVTDAGTSSNGVPFFVMERLEGETLSQRMRDKRRFPVKEAVEIAIGTLEGLHAAHQIGVVHRDVKPPNIFLLRNGRAKVLDFGVAKIQDDPGVVTARGVAVGTPRYMSPEQARGESVDGRADVYSTGLLLFETIAGVGPFDDVRDANELILAHLARNAPRLSSLAMGVPPELDHAVAQMLAKARGQRPASAQDAAERLRAVLDSISGPFKAAPDIRAAASSLDGLALAAAPPAHDTTRPDGVARQSVPTSIGGRGALSWLEQATTVAREALPNEGLLQAAVGSGSSTLLAQPWTLAPARAAAPRPAAFGQVPTQMLTVIPAPDAAATHTRLPPAPVPAQAISVGPPSPQATAAAPRPVAPVVRAVSKASRGAKPRRRGLLGAAAALALLIGLGAGLGLSRLYSARNVAAAAPVASPAPLVQAVPEQTGRAPGEPAESDAPPAASASASAQPEPAPSAASAAQRRRTKAGPKTSAARSVASAGSRPAAAPGALPNSGL